MGNAIILDGDDFYVEADLDSIKREQQDWEKAYLNLSRDLLKYVNKENADENILCSPYSLYMMLAMVLNATGGKTQKEIKKIIAPGYQLGAINNSLKSAQASFMKQMKGGKLVSSNGICLGNDLYNHMNDEFRQLVTDAYSAEIFCAGADISDRINSWVNEKTDGMIPKLIEDASAQLNMVIMNAIAFDAKWLVPYKEDDVWEDGEFNNADGTVSEVAFMSSNENYYIEDDYFEGFIKDYKGGRYALMALLPKKENDNEALNNAIEQIDFCKYYKELQNCKVCVEMPEFKCEVSSTLNDFCRGLGIENLFTNKADFSGIVADRTIQVDSILQKAVIKVDRAGTKAAAVTGTIRALGLPPDFDKIKSVTLDRPFVYAIINKEYYGLPVFAGVIRKL